MGSYLPILSAVSRRKPGTLLPLELEILGLALERARSGEGPFYGFALAQAMQERRGSQSLTAHGTLYKALGRLERAGLLTSAWEDPDAAEGRPRRRLYELTEQGAASATSARSAQDVGRPAGPVRVARPVPATGAERA